MATHTNKQKREKDAATPHARSLLSKVVRSDTSSEQNIARTDEDMNENTVCRWKRNKPQDKAGCGETLWLMSGSVASFPSCDVCLVKLLEKKERSIIG